MRGPPSHGRLRAFVIGLLLLTSYAAASVADLYAVSGLVVFVGQASLLALWAIEAALALAFAMAMASVMRLVAPRRLLMWTWLAAASAYAVLGVAFLLGARGGTTLVILGIVDKLQVNVVYFAAWAYARELFDVDQTVRYYGAINAMSFAGSLAGTAVGGANLKSGLGPAPAMFGVALLFVVGALALGPLLRLAARTPGEGAAATTEPERPVDVGAALRYIVGSPVFLCLALLGIANGCGYTILEYEVIRRIAARTAGEADPLGGFGFLFAGLRVAQPLIYSLVELTITSRLLRRVRVSRVFFSAPTAVTIGVALLLWKSSALLALAASCALQAAFAMETQAVSGIVAGLTPELRATVGVVATSIFYPIGYIVGSALLWGGEHAGTSMRALQLGAGLVGGLFALGVAVRLNRTKVALAFSAERKRK
jgi:hypothetical protein